MRCRKIITSATGLRRRHIIFPNSFLSNSSFFISSFEIQIPQLVYKEVTVTYRCGFYRQCTRSSRRPTFENQRIDRTRSVEECCDGYILNVVCVPFCIQDCGSNGYCLEPEVCGCMDGYEWDADASKCKPICKSGCKNGKCTHPDICDCDGGFRLTLENK